MAQFGEKHGYVLSAPLQRNEWNEAAQTVTPGYAYPVYDKLTKQTQHVFVPTSDHTAEGVHAYVMNALAVPRQVLGVAPAGQ